MIDLSKEFFPQPKPLPKGKKLPKPIKKIGKKGQDSLDAVEQMKKDFAEIGVINCEANLKGCWHNNALSFAHLDKRRYLSKEDLLVACLICVPCHTTIEAWKRDKMRSFLQDIIDRRTNGTK